MGGKELIPLMERRITSQSVPWHYSVQGFSYPALSPDSVESGPGPGLEEEENEWEEDLAVLPGNTCFGGFVDLQGINQNPPPIRGLVGGM